MFSVSVIELVGSTLTSKVMDTTKVAIVRSFKVLGCSYSLIAIIVDSAAIVRPSGHCTTH